jgi:hypothetical protein
VVIGLLSVADVRVLSLTGMVTTTDEGGLLGNSWVNTGRRGEEEDETNWGGACERFVGSDKLSGRGGVGALATADRNVYNGSSGAN